MSSGQSSFDDLRKPFERNRVFRKRYEILSPLVAFDLIAQGLDRGIINDLDKIKQQIEKELEKTRQGKQLAELFRLTGASDEIKKVVLLEFKRIVENVIDSGKINHGQLSGFAEKLEGMINDARFF